MWGCTRQLGLIVNVQMGAAKNFMGAGRLHALVSLQFEMNILPTKWEAMRRNLEY